MAVGWVTAGSGFMLLWPYTAEIFSTKMRSTALGLCSALARAGSVLTPLFVAGVLSASGSIGLVFAVLAVPDFHCVAALGCSPQRKWRASHWMGLGAPERYRAEQGKSGVSSRLWNARRPISAVQSAPE